MAAPWAWPAPWRHIYRISQHANTCELNCTRTCPLAFSPPPAIAKSRQRVALHDRHYRTPLHCTAEESSLPGVRANTQPATHVAPNFQYMEKGWPGMPTGHCLLLLVRIRGCSQAVGAQSCLDAHVHTCAEGSDCFRTLYAGGGLAPACTLFCHWTAHCSVLLRHFTPAHCLRGNANGHGAGRPHTHRAPKHKHSRGSWGSNGQRTQTHWQCTSKSET